MNPASEVVSEASNPVTDRRRIECPPDSRWDRLHLFFGGALYKDRASVEAVFDSHPSKVPHYEGTPFYESEPLVREIDAFVEGKALVGRTRFERRASPGFNTVGNVLEDIYRAAQARQKYGWGQLGLVAVKEGVTRNCAPCIAFIAVPDRQVHNALGSQYQFGCGFPYFMQEFRLVETK